MRRSPTFLLLDHLLAADGGLLEFVAARRAEGLSWRLTARAVRERTGHDVTFETLRNWCGTRAA